MKFFSVAAARYGLADDELLGIMREHGFSPFGHRLVGVAASNGNTVFVRNKAEVEARVKTAPRFRLVNGDI